MDNDFTITVASRINEQHELARDEADLCKGHAGLAIVAAWECGKLLIAEKQNHAHGEWIGWLQENCPELPVRTAQQYMTHAIKYPTRDALNDAVTAKAMITIGVLPQPESDGGRPLKPGSDNYLLFIQRACQWFNKCDVTKLNQTAKIVLKRQLEPLVRIYQDLG